MRGDEPAQWIAREADAVSFLPLEQGALAPGHALVVPRRHSVGVLDAQLDDLRATIELVQRVGQAMTASLGATGIVILNACGPFSGQSVDHLHFHVVPCWRDDGATFWPADRSAHEVGGDVRALLASALRPT